MNDDNECLQTLFVFRQHRLLIISVLMTKCNQGLALGIKLEIQLVRYRCHVSIRDVNCAAPGHTFYSNSRSFQLRSNKYTFKENQSSV